MSERGYDWIKSLAKDRGERITDLLVLARQNDPFFAGCEAQAKKAEWFLRWWRELGYEGRQGVHLRRIHYRLISQEERPAKLDGTPYENTTGCWAYLGDAAKAARYLGFVAPDDFVDRRNPDPLLLAPEPRTRDAEPGWNVDTDCSWSLPQIEADLSDGIDFELPQPTVTGYDYSPADQPVHMELWIEKSTMNDVLEPVCRNIGMNLVTSIGFQSITGAVNLLQRVARLIDVADGKRTRVFYVSDFDPAGDGMPVAVARQLEFWRDYYAPEADIKLTPLLLTREQVMEYKLPRIPIKDGDRRKGNFEDQYGEGAVELDALEALHPGELARLVRDAAEPYLDRELPRRLYQARREAENAMGEAWEDATGEHEDELAKLRDAAAEIVGRYEARLADLDRDLQAELEPVRGRLESVRHAVQVEVDLLRVGLPPRPESEIELPDETDWLFDSRRDYLEQLAVYKRRKIGEGGGE
jgi:hypothetical protein